MVLRVARLPGIRFEVQPPPPAQVLPRMDIAAFVGFAASGPLNVPVAIEDADHFRSVFGDDLALAWDEHRGRVETAYLAPAVRAFFRNGGKRCYVIRVAGEFAQANCFPIPGLLRQGSGGQLEQACAQARSEGGWSDSLQVGYELLSQPIQLVDLTDGGISGESHRATLRLARPEDLHTGDLLRLKVAANGEHYLLMFFADQITRDNTGGGQTKSEVTWTEERWFRMPGMPQGAAQGWAQLYNGTAFQGSPPVQVAAQVPDGASWQPGTPLTLGLDLSPSHAPQPGTLIRADFDDEHLWLVVSKTSQQDGKAVVLGMGLWESDEPAGWSTSTAGSFADRLRMNLKVRGSGSAGDQTTLGELGFAPGHASYWAGLPTDAALYGEAAPGQGNHYLKLWQAAAEPRFPLAGVGPAADLYFPLAFPGDEVLFAGAASQAGTGLERDGLDSFSVKLFLDPLLADENSDTLVATADYLTYQCPVPHHLTGIHAALRLDEATLIAVPDVLHTGWRRQEVEPEPAESIEPVPPEMLCKPPLPAKASGQFNERKLLDAPKLSIPPPSEPDAVRYVSWTSVRFPDLNILLADPAWQSLAGSPPAEPVLSYRLEEATLADFSDAVAVYTGDGLYYDLTGYGTGKYCYRVRAEILARNQAVITGNWSNGLSVRLGSTSPWQTILAGDFDEGEREEYECGLVRFHSALLQLCAARGDLFAALGLPAFFHEDEALRFARRLQDDFGETAPRLLSFAAIYHPWVHIHEKEQADRVELLPPEGVVCGAIARRTLARGAWLAAAGEPLEGVIALHPHVAAGRYLDIQEGGVNLVRREPGGLMNMSEVTLSREEEFRPIHVRRLLMLLRRLVLRQGAVYVFEPNSPSFRRQVQSGFEEILADLYTRGAFSGATPAAAYQVDVSDRLNPPASVEQGRLIVEIRVAPSQALLFLTIRLVMTGARSLQVQEG